jgi:flagellar capping protein FliD
LINDVVPGVTFTILGTTSGEETVTVSIGTSRSQMASGLANLVDSYNALLDEVNGQVGPSAGMLSGDFLVREVQDAMRALTSITGPGSMNGLADLGIEFDSDGKVEFNRNVFDGLSESRLLEAVSFLGTASSGLGGAAARFTSISDPLTGLAKLQQDRYEETDKRLTSQIAALNERISASQAALAAKLQAADALLGQLQSQQLSIEASLKGLALTLYGRNEDR